MTQSQSSLTARLAEAQEAHAHTQQYHFTIYTEAKGDIAGLVGRYFAGATLNYGVGLWHGKGENSAYLEVVTAIHIIDTLGAFGLQRLFNLAGDIKHVNEQASVLVEYYPVKVEYV